MNVSIRVLCVALLLAGCRTPSLVSNPLAQAPQEADLYDVDWWVKLVPDQFWEYAPRELATPAVDPDTDRIYVVTRDHYVRAISPAGKVEWEFKTQGPFSAGPLVADGVLYVPGGDGWLYALKARTGKLLWKYDLKEELATTPVVEGDQVLVASMTDALFAVNKTSGQWTWQYRRETPGGFTIRGASAPVASAGKVFAGFSDGYLVALDVADGTLVWERPLAQGGEFLDVDATPAVDELGGRIFVASYKDGVFALDAQTGDVQWQTSATGIGSVLFDGTNLFASGDNQVVSYAPDTGKLLWSQPLRSKAARRPVLAAGRLVVPVDSELLFLDPRTGGRVVAWDPGQGVSATPLLAGRHLYVLSNLGYLYAMYLQRRG